MTRKQLVHGLRALHEDVEITRIKNNPRTGAITIDYYLESKVDDKSAPRPGQLIISTPSK